MAEFLLSNDDGLYLLSERVSQDPLEIILGNNGPVVEGVKIQQ